MSPSPRLRSMARLTAVAFTTLGFSASAQTTYAFPGASADLPEGSHWWIASDHGGTNNRDLEAVRFDDDAKRFTRVKIPFADYAADPKNSDWVIYGLPVSAIADGEVLTCWRNAPEGLKPAVYGGDDVPHPGRTTNPLRIPRSGNHVNVRTDDGKIILYAHLQPGSVPEALCPFNDTYVDDAEDRVGDLPREVIVPAAQRVRVKRGQFLGRVGSSGASAHPHLHVHLQPMTSETTVGTSLPLPFSHAWRKNGDVDFDSSLTFDPLFNQTLNQFPSAIHPDPLLRRGDITGDPVLEVATASSGSMVVTATRDVTGRLALGSWQLTGGGQFTKLQDASAGAASSIAMAHPHAGSTRDVVTALRDGSGSLKLIAWQVGSNGAIVRKGEAGGDADATELNVAALPSGLGVVSAIRDASGHLKVSTWETTTTLDTLTRMDNGFGEEATKVAMTPVLNGRVAGDVNRFTGVVTAVRTPTGNLSLTAWEITPQKTLIQRGSHLAGAVTDVALSTVMVPDGSREMVVASTRLTNGVLRNISFDVTAAGQFVRRDHEDGETILDLSATRVGGQHLVTPVRDTTGNLRVYTWDVGTDGKVRRTGKERAGAIVSGLSATSTTVGVRLVVTAVRLTTGTGGGDLRLIAWDANLR
ncbi:MULTISPECIES: M23 family metallopeptidase [unclassified Corallococcus]|uniref:M23 family metallopeptidase n=1 Tax=unclassified Corallococcus TaxID=2685029 RepID=UPI001A8FB46E|nr:MULTISPECIES: M23 family metallopeptidase [unclassified Corallococcus]MBN9681632.1 M23 family metallopeptidase [Corallococcus sp. NCSPR001]WAS86794.1 M23 family metallopeptidase [Corallococcus sp. NCRR]